MGTFAKRQALKAEMALLQRQISEIDREIRGLQNDLRQLERRRNSRPVDKMNLNQQLKKARAKRSSVSAHLRQVRNELRSYDPYV